MSRHKPLILHPEQFLSVHLSLKSAEKITFFEPFYCFLSKLALFVDHQFILSMAATKTIVIID